MQRVTNCLLLNNQQGLLLLKPRRNWWVAPGGKMEPGEHIQEAIIREYKEETNIQLIHPYLKAVSTILITDGENILNEWMLFTFCSHRYQGQNWDVCHEGELSWVNRDEILSKPMAAGDKIILNHILNEKGVLYSTFIYDERENLINTRSSVSIEERGEV